jgi:hypothetical protein
VWAGFSLAGSTRPLRARSVVRYNVAKYSVTAAEMWARSKAATEAEIEAARCCLKGAAVVAVQIVQTSLRVFLPSKSGIFIN